MFRRTRGKVRESMVMHLFRGRRDQLPAQYVIGRGGICLLQAVWMDVDR